MKCPLKKLQQLNKCIVDCEAQMQNIRTLPYYTLFNREAERATDLSIIQHQLNTLISKRNKLTINA